MQIITSMAFLVLRDVTFKGQVDSILDAHENQILALLTSTLFKKYMLQFYYNLIFDIDNLVRFKQACESFQYIPHCLVSNIKFNVLQIA
jgi:hypothetical protein